MTTATEVKRLRSLDALRGFDMFWIVGGGKIFAALAVLTGWPLLQWWADQLKHVKWDGFHFEDMIFPLFLFIAGISFPFSMAKRCQTPEGRSGMYRHVLLRGVVLVLLGIFSNNGIRFDIANMRFGSVLGHIGLAWMFAALLFMNAGWKTRVALFWGILIGYWLLLWSFPAPDLGSKDPFSMEGSLAGYVDRLLLPGRLYKKIHDPEGILSTVPAIATAMLGMFTGEFIRSSWWDHKPLAKVGCLVAAAAGLILLGLLWDLAFPINKNLWTSSFVCFVGGLSLVLFALFYLVIDVWGIRGWDFFFVVIGMNSITIYLAPKLVDFHRPVDTLFGGLIKLFPKDGAAVVDAMAYMAVVWVFLYFLYKKKIFLKV